MTAKETAAIEKLRDEWHKYHVDVKQLVTRCESCRAEVVQLNTDMSGLPGNKEDSPGLMGDVAGLRQSRRLILLALQGAWALLTVLFGAAVTAMLRGR
jgi:hypothetical protein